MSTDSVDVRNEDPNDTGHREAQFRLGWSEALTDRTYTLETLAQLTWRNLGYRLGKLYGKTSDEMIGVQYDWSVRQQAARQR